ncbi:hypothetical protein DPMN_119674 [Dreissena polymorpha]|uniref:Uncharacterized protein n=1 Tax=Dreissena polymorpha TaxID=45954 RepID=A0A9D4GJL3_DREPO|nr:hypothetical protein DPMN_119674 [Dreissena polymorpha]
MPPNDQFELIQDIIGTNLLIKFYEDRKINVETRVLTRKNAPPPGGHFYEDRTINVASRVKNAPPLGSHVFQANVTIFELIQDIIGTNILKKFHEDWKINVASRVLTRKNVPPPGGHVFKPTGIIFELVQDIIEMNLLTKFLEDQTINVASTIYSYLRKNAPPHGSHVFQANVTIFELIQDTIKTNLMTKFHDNKCGLLKTKTIFELIHRALNIANMYKCNNKRGNAAKIPPAMGPCIQDIIGTNLLTKFHEDRKINVASTVLTRKNCPAPLSVMFHEDRTTNVASRVLTRFYIHIQLLTKFDNMLNDHVGLCLDIMKIQLLTKFGEDRMKTT